MTKRPIRVSDIPDGGARLLDGACPADPGVIVIRFGASVRAFRNDCPHAHLPLDLVPGRIMARDGRHLLCANHGALFRMTDGLCVRGPCRGRHLPRIELSVEDGLVRVRLDPR